MTQTGTRTTQRRTSGRANLTPEEYQILFGDSPEEPAGEESAQQASPEQAAPKLAEEQVLQPASGSLAWKWLVTLTAHPHLSAAVLVISVLVGAAIARSVMG